MNITLDDGRTELWQWDTGRKIVVDDKSVSEVHYSKYSSTQAITRKVIDGKAEIPNFLLQDTHAITVYAYSGSIENGYTMAEKTFNVIKKPKPANYVETEEDQAILAKLKAEIGNLDDLTTKAKANLVEAINEAAASGGGGADWAQNDPNGGGYVANRPGGYMTDPVITDADAFTITSAEDAGGTYVAVVAVESSAITLSDYAIGDGVIVDFGGQSYSLTWQSEGGYPACGAAVTDEGRPVWSSVPFHIIAGFGEEGGLQGYYVYLQNAVTSPIKVKLKMAKQTPVKIPMKYLESDVYIVKVTGKSNEQRPGDDGADVSYDIEVSATYDDIATAINAGRIPILLGGTTLSDYPVLNLVDHYTDDVDGSTPSLTFGAAYFRQSNRLYGICVYIDSTGGATCNIYDGIFVERFKGVDDAMSDTSFNPVRNNVIKKYVDDKEFILKSTTPGSAKKFKITVDDAGTLSAAEVTES